MATNHWKIIIDNFPKYFSEKVLMLYGFSTAFKSVSHMRGVWDHQMKIPVTAIPQLHLHGYVESEFYYTTQAAAKIKLRGVTQAETKVVMDVVPRLKLYGKFPNEININMDVDTSTIIYGRHDFVYRVDAEIQPVLYLRGDLDHEIQIDMDVVNPINNMKGSYESQYKVLVDLIGMLSLFGSVPSESIVQMNVQAIIATFYKFYERNDEIFADINDMTFEELCVKVIS